MKSGMNIRSPLLSIFPMKILALVKELCKFIRCNQQVRNRLLRILVFNEVIKGFRYG